MSASAMSPFLIRATIIASCGGILFGYDLGVISEALPQITNAFNLSEKQQEMLVAFLYIGCCFGAMIGGIICDSFGRKKTIIITDVLFLTSALILFSADSFEIVLLGRLLVGGAVAISGIADVAYLHEISPKEFRGAVVSCNEACISLGFLISYLCGYLISISNPNDGWRYMFGLASIIALIQIIFIYPLPESPVWLSEHGMTEELEKAFARMDFIDSGSMKKSDEDGLNENKLKEAKKGDSSGRLFPGLLPSIGGGAYSSFTLEVAEEVSAIAQSKQIQDKLQIFKSHYRQVIISIFLSVMQQFCGHPNVLNFAPKIFGQIGFDSHAGRLFFVMMIGFVKFVVTCAVIWKIDKIGRRKLLLMGMIIIAVSMLQLTVIYSVNDLDNQSLFGKVAGTASVFGVAAGYAISFGPLVWLLVSELFPSCIRGRALGGSTITSYAAAAVVSYTFLSFQKSYGLAAPFFLYFILTCLSIVFTFLAIPDTASFNSEEVMLRLETMWWWNRQGRDGSNFTPIDTKEFSTLPSRHEII